MNLATLRSQVKKLAGFMLIAIAMSAEINRNEASQEYFELRMALNRANKTKNLVTELEYEIREGDEEYFIIVKSSGAKHGLRLVYRSKDSLRWLGFQREIFPEFKKYMYKKIFTLISCDNSNINAILTDWCARLWMS